MNLEDMTLLQLRAYGKELGVKSVTTFPKGTLIEKIKEVTGGSSAEGGLPEKYSSLPKKKVGRPRKVRADQETEKTQKAEKTEKAKKAKETAKAQEAGEKKKPGRKKKVQKISEIQETEIKQEINEVKESEVKQEAGEPQKTEIKQEIKEIPEISVNQEVSVNQKITETKETDLNQESTEIKETNLNQDSTEIRETNLNQELTESQETNAVKEVIEPQETDLIQKSSETPETDSVRDSGESHKINAEQAVNKPQETSGISETEAVKETKEASKTQYSYEEKIREAESKSNLFDAPTYKYDEVPENRESGYNSEYLNHRETSSSYNSYNSYYPYNKTPFTDGGVLEILDDGYGFLRKENYITGSGDIYVANAQIKRFNLKTGDYVEGVTRIQRDGEKERNRALVYINSVNGVPPIKAIHRPRFESLVPIYPNEKIRLETEKSEISTRTIDLISPIGKGQRGMIVAQPKAGKTTLIKKIANAVKINYPEIHIIVLLIDERPEEVSDIKDSISGDNIEVIYSTFDEHPEHHKKVAEMTLERAKRFVEHGKDIVVLLDSITRLARAYNLTVPPGGRTLSGGLDAGALYMPKKFFGAARNIRNGGSLTILATALVETGSKLDDMVYEEFKGTGNMEIVLDRKLSERRIFPAIDILKSGTRREEDLLTPEELDCVFNLRRSVSDSNSMSVAATFNEIMSKTKDNEEFVRTMKKIKM